MKLRILLCLPYVCVSYVCLWNTHRWAVFTVLWIGFCHTGPFVLCIDLFVFICVYFACFCFILHRAHYRFHDDALYKLTLHYITQYCTIMSTVGWQNGRKICPDLYTIRKIIYNTFPRKRIVGGGDPFYLKFWVNRPPLQRNRRFSTDIRPYLLSRNT